MTVPLWRTLSNSLATCLSCSATCQTPPTKDGSLSNPTAKQDAAWV